jgi:hypothetical protein
VKGYLYEEKFNCVFARERATLRKALWRKGKEGNGDRLSRFSAATDEVSEYASTHRLWSRRIYQSDDLKYCSVTVTRCTEGCFVVVDRGGGATAIRVGTLTEEPCRPRPTRL